MTPPASQTDNPVSIHVSELRKSYGAVEAVRGINFEVRQGEIFGLIGPDGAGKTTTFQILAGVMEATSGTATIYNRATRAARQQTGYLTQTFSLYPDLTVAENIRYVGDLRLIPHAEIDERGSRYLKMFDMDRFTDRLAGRLSGGMKQKLALACALVAQPQVLLLDEPTTGVDPVSRREFWDTLAHLALDGLTILVATPYLDEAERCHRVALMYEGTIHQTGTPSELRRSLGAKRLEVHTPALGEAEDALSGHHEGILDVQRFGDRLDVMVPEPVAGQQQVELLLGAAGIPIDNIRVDEPALENTFVAKLRAIGREVKSPKYPGQHPHRDLMGQVAIGASSLTRHFGAFTAVRDVSVDVKYGEIYGLLGANGAGKTTTIKMLCGLIEPSTGRMELAGERGSLRSRTVRQKLGYMSQKFSLYDDLTVGENLNFFGGVYGLSREEIETKKHWVLEFAGLEGKEAALTASLPGGWKQRVAFGAAIMHEPSVLFLDEPTSGVDPLARRAFWRMINQLADMGTAILVTTHYLEEAEQCNRLGFMVAGSIVAEGTPGGVKRAQTGHLIETVASEPQRAADLLRTEGERWRISLFGDRIHNVTDGDAETSMRETRATLAAAGIAVLESREIPWSLEDVFISVVEKAKREERLAA